MSPFVKAAQIRYFILPLLLAMPLLALFYRAAEAHWILGALLMINLLTYGTYAWDKRRARSGGWRVAEFQLHILELAGGWPAAYLAQRRLRHKCAKQRYQAVFWLIVVAYQLLSLALLRG